MASPYSDLPKRAYWRTGVSERAQGDPGELFIPRFPVTQDMAVVTAGSCFAQHVGRALRKAGVNVIDKEPLPPGVPDTVANRFGYRLFSARWGNIYTARQLLQLFREAYGHVSPADPVWRRGGRAFDALRPNVEPDGLGSADEVSDHRQAHLTAVREAFESADLMVFTFGLTEAWVHRESGTVYPTAPGTIAGTYDPALHQFQNFGFDEVLADFEAFRQELMALRPNVRFLVTVSPVPLTATASGDHVEVATCYSKAVLRAVCGTLTSRYENIDYFPSFEVITSQQAKGQYYADNLRSVTEDGVATAMRLFLESHALAPKSVRPAGRKVRETAANEVCEDALLEAFAQ